MTTLKNNEYIVFQPDQVLTNDHLNQLFYYLDRQNRLTRIKLIGMGIVCGFTLDVTMADNKSGISCITITKGCGITSQGYLISDCVDKKYGYALPYTPPGLPTDLPFACDPIPFYNTTCKIYKLITYDQYKTIVETPGSTIVVISPSPCSPSQANPSSSADNGSDVDSTDPNQPILLSSMDWSDYAVVLFLEAKEKDLKNCDMQDCNNKGEKMVFHIRPLLVPKTCLTNNCIGKTDNLKAPEIKLKRFAVQTTNPVNDISSGAAILKTFQNIFNGASPNVLGQVGTAYAFCYMKYNSILPSGSNSFISLTTDLQNILTSVQNTYLVQYFYDYVNDLILAYYEFRKVADKINVQCCADECAFPLHLVLGDATKNTNEFVKDCWRTYFIYSPLFDGENRANAKLRFYYHRMEILATQFVNTSFTTPATDVKEPIKITPGEYEEFPLSQRAIPYYYNVTDTVNTQNSLYQYWDFEKAADGNSAFNQSYNAGQYNSDSLVNTPLLYDIEKNNFFRIEGHIGLSFPRVLLDILQQKQVYNLPFNVVAVAAEKFFPTLIDLQTILSCLKNLLTEFDSLVIEFLCKLILCTRKLATVGYSEFGKNTDASLAGTNDLNAEDFLKAFQFGTSVYKMGDFVSYLNPGEGTMGKAYTDSLQNNQYANLVAVKDLSCDNLDLNKSYYTGFNVLNASDNLFYTLLNTKPQELVSSVLQTQFGEFSKQFALLKTQIADSKSPIFSAALLDDCCDCLQCLHTELLWLLKQILERIQEYESEMIFANYFKKHPGLEHKAGVPKGGTFVLVYSNANLAPQPVILMDRLNSGLITDSFVAAKDPVVIADFYIPYLCCNDCTPAVYLNLPENNVQFDIEPKRFLFDDAHNYPFATNQQVTPADFDASTNPGNLNLLMDNNTLSLHPAMDIKTTLNTTLTYKSIAIPITIVVPEASFTINITADVTGAPMVTLAAKNTDATTYQWLINGKEGLFESKANPVPVSLSILQNTSGSNEFSIEFIITYIINDNTSSDDKKALLTKDQITTNLGKGPFEPTYIDEFSNISATPQAKVGVKDPAAKKSNTTLAKTGAAKKSGKAAKVLKTKKSAPTSKKRNKKP